MKEARALLGWNRAKLGYVSGTSIGVVKAYEATGRVARMHDRAKRGDVLAAIRTAFETAGIQFIQENEGGAGVRMQKPTEAADVE